MYSQALPQEATVAFRMSRPARQCVQVSEYNFYGLYSVRKGCPWFQNNYYQYLNCLFMSKPFIWLMPPSSCHLVSHSSNPQPPPFRQQLCAGVFPHHVSSVHKARVERHPISWLGGPAAHCVLPPLGRHGNPAILSSHCSPSGGVYVCVGVCVRGTIGKIYTCRYALSHKHVCIFPHIFVSMLDCFYFYLSFSCILALF